MRYYWIAINEHTVARSAFPMEQFPEVSPKPQLLLGFPTHDEAVEAQGKCLDEPIEKVRSFLEGLTVRADVAKRWYRNSEPPVPGGVTTWMPDTARANPKERAAVRRAARKAEKRNGGAE